MKRTRPDIETTLQSSFLFATPLTARGTRWMRCVGEPLRLLGVSVIYDHRMGIDMLRGALAAGLVLRDMDTGRIASGKQHVA